jgi:hypothetical protein
MTRGGNLTLIVILLILWFVGIFLAGYFGYEHFDKHKKSETNLILFVLGVVLAIGTFIGIIVLFIKRSRLPKNPMANTTKADTGNINAMENTPMLPPGYPSGPGYAVDNYAIQSGAGYPVAQSFPGASYGMQPQMMPSFPGAYPGPGAGYPAPNPYLAQQYSI